MATRITFTCDESEETSLEVVKLQEEIIAINLLNEQFEIKDFVYLSKNDVCILITELQKTLK